MAAPAPAITSASQRWEKGNQDMSLSFKGITRSYQSTFTHFSVAAMKSERHFKIKDRVGNELSAGWP